MRIKKGNSFNNVKTVLLLLFLVLILLFVPGKILQFASAFFFLLISISFAYSHILKTSIEVSHTINELRCPRFEYLEIKLRIENRSFLPIFSLYINDKSGSLSISADTGRSMFHLHKKEIVMFSYKVKGNSRGEYFTGPAKIRASDPLGFFPFTLYTESKCRILIHPAKSDEAFFLTQGIPQGKIPVKNALYEDTSVYRSVRDYMSGDEIKRINWKASARFGKLFTNEYIATLSSPCFIYLDIDISNYPDHLRYEHVEHAIETAAHIAKETILRGQHCGLASNGILTSQKTSPFLSPKSSQLSVILDTLALLAFCKKEDEDSILLEKSITACPTGGTFFYVGPYKKEEEISIKTKTLRPSLQFFTFFVGGDYE